MKPQNENSVITLTRDYITGMNGNAKAIMQESLALLKIPAAAGMEAIAKIFLKGRSQAVRLPKGFWDIFSPDTDFKTPEPLQTKDFNLD